MLERYVRVNYLVVNIFYIFIIFFQYKYSYFHIAKKKKCRKSKRLTTPTHKKIAIWVFDEFFPWNCVKNLHFEYKTIIVTVTRLRYTISHSLVFECLTSFFREIIRSNLEKMRSSKQAHHGKDTVSKPAKKSCNLCWSITLMNRQF